jgi:hypothetical protein
MSEPRVGVAVTRTMSATKRVVALAAAYRTDLHRQRGAPPWMIATEVRLPARARIPKNRGYSDSPSASLTQAGTTVRYQRATSHCPYQANRYPAATTTRMRIARNSGP